MEEYDIGDMEVQISVSKEFYDHYRKIIMTRDAIIGDIEAKDTSKSAILNTTTTILREMLAIQERLHNSENFAKLQQVVVECLKEVSPELQHLVLERFEERRQRL